MQTVQITGTRHFDLSDVKHVPVVVSDDAKKYINGSPHQGRLFPQALSEIFGNHPEIAEIYVDLIRKRDVFALAGDEDEHTQLLRITVKHGDVRLEDGVRLINADDLQVIDPLGLFGFNAAQTAQELLRLHRMERDF
jgi:hypothetical protein